jgi:uncharacterized membrane protein
MRIRYYLAYENLSINGSVNQKVLPLPVSLFIPEKYKRNLGKIAAAFFVGVFPGNIQQLTHKRSAFGLNTDSKRLIRLLFQLALVYWAIKSTGKNN